MSSTWQLDGFAITHFVLVLKPSSPEEGVAGVDVLLSVIVRGVRTTAVVAPQQPPQNQESREKEGWLSSRGFALAAGGEP